MDLVKACRENNLVLVRELLAKGANPNGYSQFSVDIPLALAVAKRNRLMVQELLEHGAYVDVESLKQAIDRPN